MRKKRGERGGKRRKASPKGRRQKEGDEVGYSWLSWKIHHRGTK